MYYIIKIWGFLKKLDLIFLKIVTKNVRKESVLKLMIRGWIYFSADF